MNVQTANALVTGAPLDPSMLRIAQAHYVELERLLALSGPRFSNARADAANMHNLVVRRLREDLDEQARRQRAYDDQRAGLVEIET